MYKPGDVVFVKIDKKEVNWDAVEEYDKEFLIFTVELIAGLGFDNKINNWLARKIAPKKKFPEIFLNYDAWEKDCDKSNLIFGELPRVGTIISYFMPKQIVGKVELPSAMKYILIDKLDVSLLNSVVEFTRQQKTAA